MEVEILTSSGQHITIDIMFATADAAARAIGRPLFFLDENVGRDLVENFGNMVQVLRKIPILGETVIFKIHRKTRRADRDVDLITVINARAA